MEEIQFLNDEQTQLMYKSSNSCLNSSCKLKICILILFIFSVGYKYQHKDDNKNSKYFVCVKPKCGASITINNHNIVIKESKKKKHEHYPLLNVQIDIELKLKELKNNIEINTSLNIHDEYNNIYRELNTKYSKSELAEHWKQWDEIRGTLSYHREINRPAQPKDNEEVNLPPEYANQLDKPFLRYNSTNNNTNQMLIFMSDEAIEILRKSTRWQLDGTFKSSPKQFYQIFTIHAYFGKKLLPCVYCLLKKKDRETYDTALQKIKNILIDNNGPINVQVILTYKRLILRFSLIFVVIL